MKAVILAGGFGTRIAEESDSRPKPMVAIGDSPILLHIMALYAKHEVVEFIVCLGYKGDIALEYFSDRFEKIADNPLCLEPHAVYRLPSPKGELTVTLVDTGLNTMTGGRLKRVASLVSDETFCLTYGDGLSDLDISQEIAFHHGHDKLVTVAAVRPPGRFAVLDIAENAQVKSFKEKPQNEVGWVNGGFFILEPEVLNRLDSDSTVWEQEPLETLAAQGQLMAFTHEGFWQPMDTLRDKRTLDQLWAQGRAPWV
jgi:glucose-1-phosphate cytidylyltransferase